LKVIALLIVRERVVVATLATNKRAGRTPSQAFDRKLLDESQRVDCRVLPPRRTTWDHCDSPAFDATMVTLVAPVAGPLARTTLLTSPIFIVMTDVNVLS
jgi:hypothetical protein